MQSNKFRTNLPNKVSPMALRYKHAKRVKLSVVIILIIIIIAIGILLLI